MRWPDTEQAANDMSLINRSGTVRGSDRYVRSARSADGKREGERERERRGQSGGVGGRRYA